MNPPVDLEQVVTAWLGDQASASGSDRVLAAALGRAATVGQERRRPTWLQLPTGVRARYVALAVLIVGLGLVFVGGAMLAASGLVRQPAPGGLLYQRDGDIVLVSRDGTDPIVVADGAPPSDVDGRWYALESWAPDGRHFVYHEIQSNQPRVVTHIADATGRSIASFEIEPATTGATPAPTPGPGSERVDRALKSKWHTWWSPDSTLLAVFPWSAEVRIFGLDGGLRATLPLPPGYGMWREFGLRWAPDGKSVFVVITADGGSDSAREVWQLALDGAPPERLAPGHALERWDVEVSPDGRRVAFSGLNYPSLEGPIYMASVDGSDPQPIAATSHPGEVSSFPLWSPDGTRLAYMVTLSYGGLNYQLRVVDLRTGTDRLVATAWDDGSINRAWSADGQRLLVRAYDVEPATHEAPSPRVMRKDTALWSIGVDDGDVRLIMENVDAFATATRPR
jgi:WD40 repeat protein